MEMMKIFQKCFWRWKISGEEGWILPVTEDHHEMLECPEADCISDLVDDCPGGSLAAAFL
jgi:leucyl aminopeptidase